MISITFDGLNDGQVRRILAAVNNTTDDAPGAGATGNANALAATAPVEPKKARKEKAAPAPAPEPESTPAYPLGGPIVKPVTLDELKRRAVLFMDDAQGGGELFAKRLAEFTNNGQPVAKLSQLPPEVYDTFLGRLVPQLDAAAPAAGGGLLD